LCESILDQEKRRRRIPNGRDLVVDASSVRKALDNLLANNDEAKATLVKAAVSRDGSDRRVLLIGPSQTSGMFLAKALAHVIDVPFAVGDPSNCETFGQGNPLFNLLRASDFDMESAQQGVVFLTGTERTVAQDLLLQLWKKDTWQPVCGLEFDIRGVLFVCGAAYAGLDEAVGQLGRPAEQAIMVEVLQAAGVRPEWTDAFAEIARVSPLDEQSLANIVNWVEFPKDQELS
jgi:ATP-dependent Clp protease ATP-binding subunit ClpX